MMTPNVPRLKQQHELLPFVRFVKLIWKTAQVRALAFVYITVVLNNN